MKRSNPASLIRTFALLAVCIGITGGDGRAGGFQRTQQGDIVRWKANTPISYAVNPGGVAGFTGDAAQVVTGAVSDAFRAWTGIPGAAITFNFSGTTSLTGDAQDEVNLVTFQDSSPQGFSFPPGVLAVALMTSAPAAGQIQLGSGKIVTAEFAGQILDADILFNPGAGTFSPVGADNTLDLVAVAMHEVGHLLGLDHTGVLSSIMNPFLESGDAFASRILQSDDALTVAALYPAATFAAQGGAIAGTVTTSAGAPVKAAHVIAVSASGGVPVASQITTTNGSYSIAGLPPGSYRVLVEPLDGPIGVFDFGQYYADGNFNFATTFLGGLQSPTTVTVVAGQSAPANVTLPATPASLVNISELGLITQITGGISFVRSPNPLFLPRGKSYEIFVTGSNVTETNLAVTGSGITGTATASDSLSTGQPIRKQTITLAGTAVLGPSNLLLSSATSTSAFPGGIVATVNPSVATPLRDAAGFGSAIAPGAFITIFGADLALGRGANDSEAALAIPLPTSMGGVSVKIGNRYAPIFSLVTPPAPALQQISVQVPFELTGTSVPVTVVAGPGATGNTVTVPLSPTAPGIFSVNFSGSGPGVVFNPDGSLAAPVGSIAGCFCRPARPGDYITIWGVGMGPVDPPLPSGISPVSTSNSIRRLRNFPQVRVGNQPVPTAGQFDFAGLSPQFVGIYQVAVQLPANVQTGNAVPVQIVTFEGQSSNTVTIAVSP